MTNTNHLRKILIGSIARLNCKKVKVFLIIRDMNNQMLKIYNISFKYAVGEMRF